MNIKTQIKDISIHILYLKIEFDNNIYQFGNKRFCKLNPNVFCAAVDYRIIYSIMDMHYSV